MKINFVEKCKFLFWLFNSCKNNPVVSTGSIIPALIVGDRFREKSRCYRVSVGYSITTSIILDFFAWRKQASKQTRACVKNIFTREIC